MSYLSSDITFTPNRSLYSSQSFYPSYSNNNSTYNLTPDPTYINLSYPPQTSYPTIQSLPLSFPSDEIIKNHSTYQKNTIFYDFIKDFPLKNTRRVLFNMRNKDLPVNVDTFFPHYGFTMGEYSTWAILTENNKKKNTMKV